MVYLHTLASQTIIAKTSKRVYKHAEKQEVCSRRSNHRKVQLNIARDLSTYAERARERCDVHLAHTRGRQRREEGIIPR